MRTWFAPDRYSRRRREETGLGPFGVAVTAQGRAAVVRPGSMRRASAPADIVERLGLRAGAEVIVRESLYLVDGEPVQVGVTYIPAAIADGSPLASDADLGPGGIYGRFEELGWPVAQIREDLVARQPTPAEAASLALPPHGPVLEVTHTSMDDWKRPFEVTRYVLRADRAGFTYELQIDD
ncbi:hypothetical protein GCM10009557_15980 [Virgisporangium ochraceum]|uniref:UbiC transcription regulator-associated domain-containing protein n=1 Tax=Virgisporangium ochraceum TaxID=65505 RepID=A0A8J3ZPX5_9ACTN|nr:UTRA domain-containing protein [Virgisporangium ochraceum]GIJ65390.1 hypothetical protein Voc01_003070 [Virgisporangium ochraceum]